MVGPSSTTRTRRPLTAAWVVEADRRCGAHDFGAAVDRPQLPLQQRDVGWLRGVDLVDDEDVGHARHRLAGMMCCHLPRPERIGDRDVEAGPQERKIVVAAVPDDDVGLELGLSQNLRIVDAREDHAALRKMRLVLLPLLHRAPGGREIGCGREPLNPLFPGRHRASDAAAPRRAGPGGASCRDSQRAMADLPQPVLTAVIAITGRDETSMVRCGPSRAKSAPAASAREATCITCSWRTSL